MSRCSTDVRHAFQARTAAETLTRRLATASTIRPALSPHPSTHRTGCALAASGVTLRGYAIVAVPRCDHPVTPTAAFSLHHPLPLLSRPRNFSVFLASD